MGVDRTGQDEMVAVHSEKPNTGIIGKKNILKSSSFSITVEKTIIRRPILELLVECEDAWQLVFSWTKKQQHEALRPLRFGRLDPAQHF